VTQIWLNRRLSLAKTLRDSLLRLAAQAVMSVSLAAQSTPAVGTQPPLMEREREIALALSACPPAAVSKAAVYVLEGSGYVNLRKSENGFTAIDFACVIR
jgi:hypothetical protein